MQQVEGVMGTQVLSRDTAVGRVLDVLLRQGSMTVKDIQDALDMSSTAIRQHLTRLLGEGLVTSHEERRGVGRPVKVYTLTNRARALTGCHCDYLAVTLLEEMVLLEGPEKMRVLLERVSRRLANLYEQEVSGSALFERVQELARALDRRGIVADVAVEEGAIVLHEYTCPYHGLAQDYRDICEMEKAMMSQVLGQPVTLRYCMMDGHQGCAFHMEVQEAAA